MFRYVDGRLHCEDVDMAEIARAAGTPCYVYSSRSILDAYMDYDGSFDGVPHMICYAVKANSTLAVLSLLARAGSDAVASKLSLIARFSLRVNPDVDAATHPYISTGLRDHKFGVDIGEARAIYSRSRSFANIRAAGVSCHIGSQILDYSPILEAAGKVLALVEDLQCDGFSIDHVDLGGGLGIAYQSADRAPEIGDFIAALRERIGRDRLTVMVEPGRSIVGPAGILLTRVLYRKKSPSKEFVVVDAAMNDLIRPSLYRSHHEILPLNHAPEMSLVADVVGPICETGDFLARDRELPDVRTGDYLAISSAGAYGFVQASNYNSRPRAAEVLVTGAKWRVVRDRENYQDLIRGERI
jgi:diaminopimelate decarboxylase